jgi:hypothetical protein
MDIELISFGFAGRRRSLRDARRHTKQQGNLSSVKYCVLTLAAMRLRMIFAVRSTMRYWQSARVT